VGLGALEFREIDKRALDQIGQKSAFDVAVRVKMGVGGDNVP
jgi:hypothetical protein